MPVTNGPNGKPSGSDHAALRSRVDERSRRRVAANRAVSSSTACASWAAVSGSSLAGSSLISPLSIVVGRSGSTLPPPRGASGSVNKLVAPARSQEDQRPSRPNGFARTGTAAEKKVPLHREALFGPRKSQAGAKTYETFTAAAWESAACRCQSGACRNAVGRVSATCRCRVSGTISEQQTRRAWPASPHWSRLALSTTDVTLAIRAWSPATWLRQVRGDLPGTFARELLCAGRDRRVDFLAELLNKRTPVRRVLLPELVRGLPGVDDLAAFFYEVVELLLIGH